MFKTKPEEFLIVMIYKDTDIKSNFDYIAIPTYTHRKNKTIRYDPKIGFKNFTTMARILTEQGLIRVKRHKEDDPLIIECWI